MSTALPPEHLVSLLASSRRRVRHAARAALLHQGPTARAALQAGLRHPDPGVRAACGDLLRSETPAPRWSWRRLTDRLTRRALAHPR